MLRRQFIAGLGSTAAWPAVAQAQQPAKRVIGVINPGSPGTGLPRVRASLLQGLRETGYIEGRNLVIDHRWAEEKLERLPIVAADLVADRVDVIYASGSTAALAAQGATTTLPIVFSVSADPVKIGLVASLNRPGGNITGMTTLGADTVPKRLELLREVLLATQRIALLINPAAGPITEIVTSDTQMAARTLGTELIVLHVSTESDVSAAFANLPNMRADALVISSDVLFVNLAGKLGQLALHHGVPAIYEHYEFAANGGLMSYGANYVEPTRQAGAYIGRILNGEKPADLPVGQATKVELIINLKTAKALGIMFPLTLLGRADEVIE